VSGHFNYLDKQKKGTGTGTASVRVMSFYWTVTKCAQ